VARVEPDRHTCFEAKEIPKEALMGVTGDVEVT
jgi:hypothetical protein